MAQKFNLSIDQGTSFSISLTVVDANNNPLDLTGFQISSALKKSYYSLTSYPFSTLSSNVGIVQLTMDANTTSQIEQGRYVYDVKSVSNNNTISRLVEGIATINPMVTS